MGRKLTNPERIFPLAVRSLPPIPSYRPVRRVAMPVVHSNPLAEPGAGDAGGMTVYVREVARALAGQGIAVDIFTRRSEPGDDVAWLSPGVRVIQIEAGPLDLSKEDLPSFIPQFTSNLAEYVELEGLSYDIIHSHYWLSGKVAARLKERWSVPFVHTFHTLGRVKNEALRAGDLPEPPLRLVGEGKVIEEACAIVASTDEERRCLVDLYSAHPERIHLIPPGVDHRLFTPGDKTEARRLLGIDPADKVLLFVGRLQPLKAVDTAIQALAELADRDRRIRLLVVGGASGQTGQSEPQRLARLADSLGVSSRLTFVPAQPQTALPDFYRAADVCLVPSHTESFGLVALEAQSCGLPVVASSVGGLKHIVQHGRTGYLVSPWSPRAFAERAFRIMTDEATQQNMSSLAVCSSGDFSWERSARELKELYSSSEHLDCREALAH